MISKQPQHLSGLFFQSSMNATLMNKLHTKFSKSQSGIALFIALIAIVAMSLAAVALIRSVDTNSLVAGNVALKQSSTNSADSGIEAAITQIAAIRDSSTLNVISEDLHPLNKTQLSTNKGYYSNLASTFDVKAASNWTGDNSVLVATDAVGNEVRYLSQRMCRFADQAPASTTLGIADCVFSAGVVDSNGQGVKLADEICKGSGCPTAGQTPLIRVTVRVKDPRGSMTYVQAIVH
jgi:type IV pilus assembly protein PilX